jgi:hypothetical protein
MRIQPQPHCNFCNIENRYATSQIAVADLLQFFSVFVENDKSMFMTNILLYFESIIISVPPFYVGFCIYEEK